MCTLPTMVKQKILQGCSIWLQNPILHWKKKCNKKVFNALRPCCLYIYVKPPLLIKPFGGFLVYVEISQNYWKILNHGNIYSYACETNLAQFMHYMYIERRRLKYFAKEYWWFEWFLTLQSFCRPGKDGHRQNPRLAVTAYARLLVWFPGPPPSFGNQTAFDIYPLSRIC